MYDQSAETMVNHKPRRVSRGDSWDNNVPSWVRAAARVLFEPAYRLDVLGFRCVVFVKRVRWEIV